MTRPAASQPSLRQPRSPHRRCDATLAAAETGRPGQPAGQQHESPWLPSRHQTCRRQNRRVQPELLQAQDPRTLPHAGLSSTGQPARPRQIVARLNPDKEPFSLNPEEPLKAGYSCIQALRITPKGDILPLRHGSSRNPCDRRREHVSYEYQQVRARTLALRSVK